MNQSKINFGSKNYILMLIQIKMKMDQQKGFNF